jgi:gamma-glutamylputrescine oxidase
MSAAGLDIARMATPNGPGYPDSYYVATAVDLVDRPELEEPLTADVCVIGGGFTGLSAALNLAEMGMDVVLLEAERIGFGASGRCGGLVGTGQRMDVLEMEEAFGYERSKQFWQFAEAAKDEIRMRVEKHAIDCDLPLDSEQVREFIATEDFYEGFYDPESMAMHPLNYTLGLARAATEAGVRIYENSRVTSYTRDDPAVVSTSRGTVKAAHVVLGCNGYLGDLEPRSAGKIMPINNFMIATEPLGEERALELINGRFGVHDTRFVVNYFRISEDHRLLYGGGENYRPGFPKDIAKFVRPYMLRMFPQLEGVKIDYAWGGTLSVTVNRLPHFGRLEPNVWLAQGYSGHGISTANFAGKVIAEAIHGVAGRFDAFASLPTYTFPGGTMLRYPGMVLGMLYYGLKDRL